jgi:hypothetical protein
VNLPLLKAQLAQQGLCILSLIDKHVSVPQGHTLILVGHGATGFWPIFKHSQEYLDQQPDPINRWSQRLGQKFAITLQGSALFPFTGPPYQPFLSWAQTNGDSAPSPLGLHFHRQHGLWHAYRFGLIVNTKTLEHHAHNPPPPAPRPCTDCAQPCMTSCPVGAFSSAGYDVTGCRTYVAQNPNSGCAQSGCIARLACPHTPPNLVSSSHGGYEAAQHQYHMAVFVKQEG